MVVLPRSWDAKWSATKKSHGFVDFKYAHVRAAGAMVSSWLRRTPLHEAPLPLGGLGSLAKWADCNSVRRAFSAFQLLCLLACLCCFDFGGSFQSQLPMDELMLHLRKMCASRVSMALCASGADLRCMEP